MPPSTSEKKLTAEQISLLTQWIAQGANYSDHWAFVAPQRPVPPEVKNPGWVKTPIDQFILAKLEKEGLSPEIEGGQSNVDPPRDARSHRFATDTE